MNRKWVALFLAVAVVVSGLLYAGAPLFTGDVAAAPSKCNIEGAWVSSFTGPLWNTPLVMQETLVPLDPAGKKLAYTMHLVNPDATFGGGFPAEYMSDLVGEAVKTGRNEYEFSLIGYGVRGVADDRDEIVYIWTVTGTMMCSDGENKTDMVQLAVYLGEQDADGDGYPDDGEVPVFCTEPGPFAIGKRVPQMSACEPTQ